MEGQQVSLFKSVVLGIIIVVLMFSGYFIWNGFSKIKKQELAEIEARRAPEFSITYLVNKDCPDCFDIKLVEEELKSLGATIKETKEIEYLSEEGKKIVEKFAVTKIPNALISGDLNKKPEFAALWSKIGRIIEDQLILDDILPPYLDIESNTIKGKFKMILLADVRCTECYDVNLHKDAFRSMLMVPSEEVLIDISSKEGKDLIKKYKIELVPTILLQGDLAAYSIFKEIWPEYGTNEADDMYVFRKIDRIGVYKNLKTGKIVSPVTTTTPAN